MSNHYNPELRVTANPIPPSDLEQAAIALMWERFDSDTSANRRLAAIEEDAAKIRAIRDDNEILAKSKTLAAAPIRAIERREERA